MTDPTETESNWDSLADELGLPVDPKPTQKSQKKSEVSEESQSARPSFVEVVLPPTPDSSVRVETDGHATVSVRVGAQAANEEDESDEGDAGFVEGEGSPEGEATEGGEEPARGRKRKRKRRRGRRGATETAADAVETGEIESDEDEQIAAPAVAAEAEDDSEEIEDAPELADEDEGDVEPTSAVDEEMAAEVAGPKHEWSVVSWVDLVAGLHRPER